MDAAVCIRHKDRKIATACRDRQKAVSLRKHVIEKDMFLKNMKFFDSLSEGKKKKQGKNENVILQSLQLLEKRESSLMINGFWT